MSANSSATPQVQVENDHSTGSVILPHVDDYLQVAREHDASDIHMAVAAPPIWRRYGRFQSIWGDDEKFAPADTERLARGFLTEPQFATLARLGNVEFAYTNPSGRYRASVVRQRLGYDICFRLIKSTIRSMDDLGLPAQLKLLTQYHNGLVLVTGAVGSGKSTTLAAMIDQINQERHDHIITLEDPVEFVFESKGCHLTQREIHLHSESFASALRASLREDPDVIMVGEMRDLETIQLAITASETGHLVLGTLHTANASRTLDRVLDVFPVTQRDQIRTMVSESLRGIVSQQLIPHVSGSGRVLALEILMNNAAVGNLIREGKTYMLPGQMQIGKQRGMKLMDDSILDLLQAGLISQEDAYLHADDKTTMRQRLGLPATRR